jgi:hypothetical protein
MQEKICLKSDLFDTTVARGSTLPGGDFAEWLQEQLSGLEQLGFQFHEGKSSFWIALSFVEADKAVSELTAHATSEWVVSVARGAGGNLFDRLFKRDDESLKSLRMAVSNVLEAHPNIEVLKA